MSQRQRAQAHGTARQRWGEHVGRAVLVLVSIGMLVAAGLFIPRAPLVSFGIAVAAVALGLTLMEPVALPTLAVPAMLVVSRVSVGGNGVTVSDVVLGVVLVPAILLGQRPLSRELNSLLGLNGIYQFATLLTVVNNPYAANIIEWFHAWLLVSGALLVGWAVGRAGRGPMAIRLLLVMSAIMALGTLASAAIQYAQRDFGPVYPDWPFPMHKNFAGTVLGLAAILVYLHPPWFQWRTRHSGWLLTLLLAAVAVTQSRQALVGLVAVFFLVVLLPRVDRRRSKAVLVVAGGIIGVVGVMVQDQLQSGNKFNSANQRLNWFQDAVDIWLTDPWFGVGLRWWYTERFEARFQPPNAELEVLTSAGLVGLAAFVVCFAGAIVVLRRMDPLFGLLPSMVLIARLVQAQFDLFWASVIVSLPWLIVGVAVGAHAWTQAESDRESLAQTVAPSAEAIARSRAG